MRFQTLDEWLDWQSGLHPAAIELGLARVTDVWCRLRPEGLSSRVITVAGTNGKGSCVAMLEEIYRKAGYRVGAYTSPHLIRYNERIRIDGRELSDTSICAAFQMVDQARGDTSLTYFEFGTLAALELFSAASLDLVILEVGLGGRLDAVNILDPSLALITTVDLDHQDWLGESREEIGFEKAGIMRRGIPVVLGDGEMPQSVLQHAEDLGAQVFQYGKDFSVNAKEQGFDWLHRDMGFSDLPRPRLAGALQLKNAASVLMACHCLSEHLPLSEQAVKDALTSVSLPGRFQLITDQTTLVFDVAHNPQAVAVLRENLAFLSVKGSVYAVFGLLADKNAQEITRIMAPVVTGWYLVSLPGYRGQSAEQLRIKMAGVCDNLNAATFESAVEALDAARSKATAGDLVLVFGSFTLVGELLKLDLKMNQEFAQLTDAVR